MIKARIRWCTCRVENILTLGKLLSLWFCFLLHSILFLISQTSYRTYQIISRYELARPIMGTIFLVVCCLWWGIWVGGLRSVCSERVASLHGYGCYGKDTENLHQYKYTQHTHTHTHTATERKGKKRSGPILRRIFICT